MDTTANRDKLGLSRQQIGHDLKAIEREWKEETAFDLDGFKALQLAKLNHLEYKSWESFELSKKRFRQVIVKDRAAGAANENKQGSGGDPDETIVKTETRNGDPQFLDKILSCIRERCKILGLYAPSRIEGEQGVIVIGSLHARGVDEDKL
jgi:hypothetical protein